MDIAIVSFLLVMIVPAVFVTLYIRREIRKRQDATRDRLRELEHFQRRQSAAMRNPKSVSRHREIGPSEDVPRQ